MASKVDLQASTKRLMKEYKKLLKEPVPNILAKPNIDVNIFEWYYILVGPTGSHYEGGYYFGKLTFPHEYPFKPPSIIMITPNGRFATNTRLCLSMSDFHPETWNCLWSVGSILTGLQSFMLEETPTHGSIQCSVEERRRFASESLQHNTRNPLFRSLYPEHVELANKIAFEKKQAQLEARKKLETNESHQNSEMKESEKSSADRSLLGRSKSGLNSDASLQKKSHMDASTWILWGAVLVVGFSVIAYAFIKFQKLLS
eukprot:TRINITY_DN3200_c0_g1_i1.p1 TRINITY_DN3200_c0_g1~~TRINITY_DN3200_c0_g1_i1.p1  ORF type:complete len:258 (-),score=55.42 TRINITY_DN3200_c0_g1_i1:253-1026(-)